MALCYQLAVWIATQATSVSGAGAMPTIVGYAHVYYSLLAWWGLAVAAVFLIAVPKIKRLMYGIH